MEHIRINENTRLEKVNFSMATIIFTSIDRDRKYLRNWLPFVDATYKISDTQKFLHSILDEPASKRNEIFSIWHKEEFAGLIGFNDIDWLNKKTEIGYWLTEKMQGKGIITLCAEKLIKYAFQKLKLNRIQIKVAAGNYKSAAIPKRLGFSFEGLERSGELHGKQFHDLEIYSFLKKDSK
jgi:ribosomal-protein-serine acetyltransferase